MELDPLFQPKSVAVVGASEKPTIGRRLILSLERIGYRGAIFPVNPNYRTVLGRACWPDVGELPEPPDTAVLCMGHERVLAAVEASARRGAKAAVVYDGGFAERDEAGRRRQARIAAICREAGIALCGPNCMGVLSPHHPSTTYLQELRDPAGLAGNVGLIAQSGAFCVSLLTDIRRFGFSHVASSGNEAVLTAADYLEYLADDPHTAIIGAFIETIREPERFAVALDRAAANGKPAVVLKVGRAPRTRYAVTSHTGGEAGDSVAASELLRAHHAIEVADLTELTEVLAAFQGWKPPAGRRIGIVTSSGGLAELILDLAEPDIALPPLPPAAKTGIEARIGPVTGDGNPLDAWGSGTFARNLPQALALFEASPDHDIIALCRDGEDGQPFDTPGLARSYLDLFAGAAARSTKPHFLLHTRPGVMDRDQVAQLRRLGVPAVGGLGEGLRAIDRLARWSLAQDPQPRSAANGRSRGAL
ncbi:MAG TPA: CoA-binding protein [Stellaceae bacterium]|jgi:acyl-CoA synthetase (NDP forming)